MATLDMSMGCNEYAGWSTRSTQPDSVTSFCRFPTRRSRPRRQNRRVFLSDSRHAVFSLHSFLSAIQRSPALANANSSGYLSIMYQDKSTVPQRGFRNPGPHCEGVRIDVQDIKHAFRSQLLSSASCRVYSCLVTSVNSVSPPPSSSSTINTLNLQHVPLIRSSSCEQFYIRP